MDRSFGFLFFLVGLSLAVRLAAQDGHYWTQQYGNKSMLLNGSVIGGVEDLGAVFYNPGRLGLLEDPGFLLSADVYEWQRVRLANATDASGTLKNSQFGGVPSLVAGSFNLGFLPGHRFAYALLQRGNSDLEFTFEDEAFGELIPGTPGAEYFRAALAIQYRSREEWASLGWSMPLGEHYGLGVTTNLLRFKQSRASRIDLHAYNLGGQTSIYTYDRSYSLERFGLLWKVGLAAVYDRVWLGLTLTTPAIGLWGDGKFRLEEFAAQVPDEDDGYVTVDQADLPATYRRPWSVGLGATFPMRRGKVHLSGEWFSAVPHYVLMQAEEQPGQSHGEPVGFVLYDDLRSTLNAGVGLEYILGEQLSLFGSFATDFSVVGENSIGFTERQPEAASSTFGTDLYHLGGGFILKLKGIDLTLGLTHVSGEESFKRTLDFPDEEEGEPILPEDETSSLRWSRWRIVFAFEVPFLSSTIEKLESKF